MQELAEANFSSNYISKQEQLKAVGDNEMLDYNGAVNFTDRKNSQKDISFGIVNTTGKQIDLALTTAMFETARAVLPGASPFPITMIGGTAENASDAEIVNLKDNPADMVAAGHTVEAVLDNGLETTGIVYKNGTGTLKVTYESERTPRMMRDFLAQGGAIHVNEIHITSANPTIFSKKISVKEVSAVDVVKEINILFSKADRPTNANENKIIVTQDFVLTQKSLASLNVPIGADFNMTFYVSFEAYAGKVAENTVNTVKRNRITNNSISRRYIPHTTTAVSVK